MGPRLIAAACAVLALAACTPRAHPTPGHGTAPAPTATSAAAAMCLQALGRPATTATITTVGDVRALRVGPGFQPAADAFPKLADSAPAAWCWTGSDGTYDAYGVTADGGHVHVGGMSGIDFTPSGSPQIP